MAQDVVITVEDCGTILGLEMTALKEGEDIIEPLADRIVGNVALEDVYDPIDGELLVEAGSLIDEEAADAEVFAAMDEALAGLEARGLDVDALRIRAFPFPGEVFDFIAHHELVFVVEQNRDAQLRTLLINEGGVDPARLVKVLNYDGSPITARFIQAELARGMGAVDANSAGEMAQ